MMRENMDASKILILVIIFVFLIGSVTNAEEYTLVMKDNTVVSVDPPGKYNPLYQRDHYRENQVRWLKVNRFVSDEHIVW